MNQRVLEQVNAMSQFLGNTGAMTTAATAEWGARAQEILDQLAQSIAQSADEKGQEPPADQGPGTGDKSPDAGAPETVAAPGSVVGTPKVVRITDPNELVKQLMATPMGNRHYELFESSTISDVFIVILGSIKWMQKQFLAH